MITGREGFIGSRLIDEVDDAIIHLDAVTGINQAKEIPAETFQRNVANTAYYLEMARQQGLKFVLASSAAAANPTNPYAASKAAAEAWCQAYRHTYETHVSILRFGNVYGPGSWYKTSCVARFCRDALEKGEIHVHGDGKQTRDLVYVDDVVKGILMHPDGLWGVRTGRQHSIIEVAEIIASLSGAKIQLSTDSFGAESSVDDSERLELNYMPLFEGLKRTWEWFKARSS